MHSFQSKPAVAHAFALAIHAVVFIALFTACGSDSAAFAPSSDATSAGGEQPGTSPAGSEQPGTARPSAAAPSGSASDATPTAGTVDYSSAATTEAAPAVGQNSGTEPIQPSAAATSPARSASTPPSGTPPSIHAGSDPQPTAAPPTGHASAPQPTAASKSPAAGGTQTAAATHAAGASPPPAPGSPSASAAAAQPPSAAAAHVIVELQGLKSDSGKIQAALFRTSAGFPEDPNKAAVRKLAKINGKKVELAFDVSPPGTFVVLVHHDENGDSKMQRGMFGQPAEGWGATRDPAANFGPPSFDDAKLTINAGETKRVVIKMRY